MPTLTRYINRLTQQRYSGRRVFILRCLLARPDTLPAGPTRTGQEQPRGSLITGLHGVHSAVFNKPPAQQV